ncbi:glycosyltransferase family 61 protein [Spirosoma rhododendri]|uniref:Glycosyltransferase family 61 protein n=1 Tax=Spirosoma rhododendri TaxID=2728024 RepID=A0A7L5DT26_9BACT|nr:glycosyltransferase family 61 protein [Spirosoma rhododendri]QJD79738.1 glycosyltransferase family 61 protein [Spirosoma rhododendri]
MSPLSFKETAKASALTVARLLGVTFLDKNQTIDLLRPYEQVHHPANRQLLSAVPDLIDPTLQLFDEQQAESQPTHAWLFERGTQSAVQLRCGNVKIGGKVLCTDYGNESLLRDSLRPGKRTVIEVDTLVAPFGHYQDGIVFGGYYDFIYLVAAKLSRIRQSLPGGFPAGAVVAYPLFHTSYEQEFLAHLGFQPDQIFDTRQYDVRFKRCLLGSSGHWFYPNASDVRAIRNELAPLIQPSPVRERVYISRVGRRRVLNEDELTTMLARYDFTVIEDTPRTLREQLAIYNRASVVLGPHGASFSNLIWCQPGTQLIELFSANYVPNFFQYLSSLSDLRYAAVRQGQPDPARHNDLTENIQVDVSAFERGLNQLFEDEHRSMSLR